VLPRKFRNAVVHLVPHLIGGDRSKLAARHFDSKIEGAPMSDVHNRRFRAGHFRSEAGHEFDGLLRGR